MNQPKRPRRRRRLPIQFDLTKAFFVLPNLFTLSSVFCGLYAIVHVTTNPSPDPTHKACLAVFFGIFFDMTDGRVARLTKTQSDFGVQLDSLADAITFGVAPAIITYQWSLNQRGLMGLVLISIYVGCGVIRLARFNVIANRSHKPSPFFDGIPIPLAAGLVTSLIMYQTHQQPPSTTGNHLLIGLLITVSALMVSNIPYRNFKDLKPTPKSLFALCSLVAIFVVLAIVLRPSFALFTFFSGYVVLGIVESVLRITRRRSKLKETPPQP